MIDLHIMSVYMYTGTVIVNGTFLEESFYVYLK